MKRTWADGWLFVPLPLFVGVVAAAFLDHDQTINPLFHIRADLRAIISLSGILTSLLLLAAVVWRSSNRRHARAVAAVQAQANEDRRRFLQRLDHELKNPLMAIRAGLANFVDAPTSQARREALCSVETQTVRLSRLTADLRKIAELETRPLEQNSIDLTELLEEAISLIQNQPGNTRRHLTLTVPQAPWPLPLISGDWDLILLSVYNLLENAIKFTGPEGKIEVRARENGRYVLVEVADTGPGIDSDELPHVWEELYRGQGARGIPGSGLGLALVKAVAERHGGEVSLHSRAGQGTVVSVQLPVSADIMNEDKAVDRTERRETWAQSVP